MSLNKNIIDGIERCDFDILSETSEYIELRNYTPAGEDWNETFWHYGDDERLAHEIYERWNTFDVDEEAERWIDNRGKNGVPSSIKVLVEDQEWKEKKLEDLWRELNEVLVSE